MFGNTQKFSKKVLTQERTLFLVQVWCECGVGKWRGERGVTEGGSVGGLPLSGLCRWRRSEAFLLGRARPITQNSHWVGPACLCYVPMLCATGPHISIHGAVVFSPASSPAVGSRWLFPPVNLM